MSNWNYNKQNNKSSGKSEVGDYILMAFVVFSVVGILIFSGYFLMNIGKSLSELNFMIPLLITVGLSTAILLCVYISDNHKVKHLNSFLVVLVLVIVLGFVGSFVSAVTKAANEPRRTYVCDYCGDRTNHHFTVGKQDLCYDCYQLYKKGK